MTGKTMPANQNQTPNSSQPGAKTLRNRRKRQRRSARMRSENNVLKVSYDQMLGTNSTRGGLPKNPADPRTRLAMANLGNTITGRMAAIKILHPNGEGSNVVTKLPDGKATTSVVMERRDEFDLVPRSDATAADTWSCIIVDSPFLIGTQVAVRYLSASAPSIASIRSSVAFGLGEPADPPLIYPQWFPNPSHPEIDVTVLQSTTLTPEIAGTATGLSTFAKSIRRTYMGTTFDLNAPDLANQGRVVAGQWNPDVALSIALDTTVTPGVDHEVYKLQVPALTEPEIVQTDELRVAHEAKLGLYMPTRMFCDADFTSANEWRNVSPQGEGEPIEEAFVYNLVNNDLWLRGWCVGVSHWTGLSLASTIRIKRNEGLELVSAPQSTYAPFSTPALPNDERSLSIIKEFARTQPHAYVASYNELGTLLQKILGGVGSAIGSLGIPVISDLGNTVSGFVGGDTGSKLAGLLDSIL